MSARSPLDIASNNGLAIVLFYYSFEFVWVHDKTILTPDQQKVLTFGAFSEVMLSLIMKSIFSKLRSVGNPAS